MEMVEVVARAWTRVPQEPLGPTELAGAGADRPPRRQEPIFYAGLHKNTLDRDMRIVLEGHQERPSALLVEDPLL